MRILAIFIVPGSPVGLSDLGLVEVLAGDALNIRRCRDMNRCASTLGGAEEERSCEFHGEVEQAPHVAVGAEAGGDDPRV